MEKNKEKGKVATQIRLLSRRHPWPMIILLISLSMNTVAIRWGLPNTNGSWAVDSFDPLAPLARVKKAWLEESWNSGWFHYKYPLGQPLVLAAVQLPYMIWLRVTGQFKSPTSHYPYGFQHPEHALTVLALLTRAVSALTGVGVVALAYVIGARLFGAAAGLVAAVLVTGCYPFVYYAHTSNIDVPLLFWIALAVAATLICADRRSVRWALIVGVAAGMALFTKEQSIGVVVALPMIWLVRRWAGQVLAWKEIVQCGVIAGVGFLAVTLVVGNLGWNPAGFINRWCYLLGVLPVELRDKYTPYNFITYPPTASFLSSEIERLRKVLREVTNGLTWPVLLLCLAGTVWALRFRTHQAAILLLTIVTYYAMSLRAVGLVPVRYTMPLLYCALLLGGALGGAVVEHLGRLPNTTGRRLALVALGAAVAMTLLPGIEIDRLLLNDPRYAAEAWLQTNVLANARVEIYQENAYLPRFSRDRQVVYVPLEERTVALFQQRQPYFVILSSSGQGQLIGQRDRDWQPGKPFRIRSEQAKEFVDRLRSGQIGYRCVARFHTPTRWIISHIGSLNPEIMIFARDDVN